MKKSGIFQKGTLQRVFFIIGRSPNKLNFDPYPT